ncbi:hypothetical protein [Streptomyces sp. NPDC048172]|uniref:hypothetical protein n=1 Tax=Streptomyces sp. NPDC048172 TaxID=3365505 RepID=UPI003716F337
MTDDSTEEEAAYLASLRPSRIREVQAGRLGWTEVDVLGIGDAAESGALRTALEPFGVHVNHFPVGSARHFVAALGGRRTPAPYVLLCCHGDEGRILLEELAEEIARFQPFPGHVGPAEVRTHVRLPGSVVISTGCETGAPELAEAFLEAGASAYVAPEGAPFGYASVFAPLLLFYELTETRSLEAAVGKLRAHDEELAMWRLFRRERRRGAGGPPPR